MLWLAKFLPALGTTDLATALTALPLAARLGWCVAVIALAGLLFLVARRAPALRRGLVACTAGLAGMMLETVLLLHYQSRNGVLYQDVGLLLTSFMGGLALGALACDRITAGGTVAAGPVGSQRLARGLSVALLLLGIVVAHRVSTAAAATFVETGTFLAAGGALAAALFSHASQYRVSDQQAVVSPLYAADLAGGAVGAILGTLLLIPLAGLVAGALVVAVLAALALLLV
jgi:spermidine synthase